MSPDDILECFEPNGALANALPGFTPRVVQQLMAVRVAEAFEQGENLIVEAGTGTGKTYAYLVPALLSGKRVVISTGTKNLQDQLFQRDLPRIREALGVNKRISLLKGRANYLCHHRIEKARQDVRARPWWPRLADIAQWAGHADSGEVSELPGEAPDDLLQARITSTADNCLGSKCPDFAECFVVKARRAAAAADIVVVNHALLFADHLIRQDGFAVLPGADAVVIDEAHQLPDLALRHFGSRVSTQQLTALVRDAQAEVERWNDTPALSESLVALAAGITRLEACFTGAAARQRTADFAQGFGVEGALFDLENALVATVDALRPLEERSAEFSSSLERGLKLQDKFKLAVDLPARDEHVRWVEAVGRGGALNATPLDVSSQFAAMRSAHPGAWIFTSATLAAGSDFTHFAKPLGLQGTHTERLDSPFNYREQTRLWMPPGLPDPNEASYNQALSAAIEPVLRASGGGAFVLCTSHRALAALAVALRKALPQLEVLAQGEAPKSELTSRFAEHGNAVLVATASFWEGVDVKGQALRVVIIDRLPFAAPGDPVLDAKLDAIRQGGGNPFAEDQLPKSIVTLRQGVGRLIRDENDRGLLMLCDPRLRNKSYGRKVLASLPDMPQLGSLEEVEAWCRTLATTKTVQ